jgi:hypothetical protein
MNRNFILSILLSVVIVSCSKIDHPENIDLIVNNDQWENSKELRKVLRYYRKSTDSLKLKAAYYLISEIENKFGLYYKKDVSFFSVLSKIDSSLIQSICTEDVENNILKYRQEEKEKVNFDYELEKIFDADIITGKFLITNINLAFKVWKEKPWAQHLNFEEFCEWILPYRISNEPLQNWREFLYNELKWIEDSLNNPSDPKEVCMFINKIVADRYFFSDKLNFLPILGCIDSWNYPKGVCDQRYLLVTFAMRAMGVPVSIDFTPQFARKTGSHSWMILLDNDGNTKSFNGGEKEIKIYYPALSPIGADELVTSIYRYKFSVNKNSLINSLPLADIPPAFRNPYVEAVTKEYGGIRNEDLSLEIMSKSTGNSFAFLFSFNIGMEMKAVSYSRIKNNRVSFSQVGRGGVYVMGYYRNNKIIFDGNPFIFPEGNSGIIYLNPGEDNYSEVCLTRKFNVKWTMKPFIGSLIGGRIEGANNREFSDAMTLYVIQDSIDYYREIILNEKRKFRYYRYIPADTNNIRIAELGFYYNNSEHANSLHQANYFSHINSKNSCDDTILIHAFDGKINTNFNAPVGSYLAVDNLKPVSLYSFKILVRNHLNIIEPGYKYVLYYFNYGWNKLAEDYSTDYKIIFKNVPTNSLLLLRNISYGKEVRIFTWNGEKQVWW